MARQPAACHAGSLLTAGLAAASAGLASVPTASAGDERSRRSIGIAPEGSTAVEFRAHLNQTGPTGEHFIAFGYLTRVEGASDSELFAAQEQDETTALLTAFASGDLSRRIHDGSVHSIDIEGSLTIYQRPVPGASWDDPTSFQFGDQVATFKVTLQDVLTVFAPGKGLPTLERRHGADIGRRTRRSRSRSRSEVRPRRCARPAAGHGARHAGRSGRAQLPPRDGWQLEQQMRHRGRW